MAIAMAVIGSIAVPGGAASAELSDADSTPEQTDRKYVVLFEEDAEAARVAVEEAGGEVIDVVEPLNVALAVSDRAHLFVENVQASAAVRVVISNHRIGTTGQQVPRLLDSDGDGALRGDSSGVAQDGSTGSIPSHRRTEPLAFDDTSPSWPPARAHARTVTSDCLTLPAEDPSVITVSSVGRSTRKADYSNYGLGSIEVAAPGGWRLDRFGTPGFDVPENLVLSSVPLQAARDNGWLDENGLYGHGIVSADAAVQLAR